MLIRLACGALAGLLLVLFSVKKRILTLPAALLALALLLDILAFGGYLPAAYILAVFLLTSLLHAFNRKKKARHAGKARGIGQVAANGGIGGIMLLLYGILGHPAFLVAYYAAVAEFFVDTLASDIGAYARRAPFDLCRMRRVPTGSSGGVSLLGTAAALVGALITLLLSLGAGLSHPAALIASGAALLGMLLDSALGSLLQAKYRCRVCGADTEEPVHCHAAAELIRGRRCITNSAVNLLSNAFSALFAGLLALLL